LIILRKLLRQFGDGMSKKKMTYRKRRAFDRDKNKYRFSIIIILKPCLALGFIPIDTGEKLKGIDINK
jgi:hypothetical protein